jgi:hypothetical protein
MALARRAVAGPVLGAQGARDPDPIQERLLVVSVPLRKGGLRQAETSSSPD